MSRGRKLGLVLGGYAAALLLAWGVVRLQGIVSSRPDQQASGGMSAFGDALLFLGVFVMAAIPPTAALLYFLYKRAAGATPLLSNALIGTWELVSREDRTPDGEPRVEPSLGADPVALLVYDRRGHFAAQFMKRDRSSSPEAGSQAAGPNNTRARDGYDAYFGTYTVDDANGTVTQRLTGALSAENVGLVVTRGMTVRGDELLIRLETAGATGEPVIRTLVWRRVA
jgi:hypothetical protein